MSIIDKPTAFLSEVKVEMSKVSWPTFDELKGSTWVVILISMIFAVFIFGIDKLLGFVMSLLY